MHELVIGQTIGGKYQNSFAGSQVELKGARRGEVFGEIQTALPFLLVDKVAVPVRLVPIFAIVQGDDSGNLRIRMPSQPLLFHLGLKLKTVIFMVQGVIVAAGHKRLYRHGCFGCCIQHSPGKRDYRCAVGGENFLLNLRAVFEGEDPCGPWFALELDDARCAVRMHDIGRVELRRQRAGSARRFYRCVEAVDENEASHGRFGCRQQQRMVAASPNAGDAARSEAAAAVGFEPLSLFQLV